MCLSSIEEYQVLLAKWRDVRGHFALHINTDMKKQTIPEDIRIDLYHAEKIMAANVENIRRRIADRLYKKN